MPSPAAFDPTPAMFARLFKFFVLAFVLLAAYQWLFNREQRRSLREWTVTLAQAFLVSAVLFVGLYLLGWRH
ncbi:hypothetical protein LH427_08680 [Laribacter hongkongensis]|uniref:protein MIGRI n=1 Tax=Laribacter hongkongensis TaxID=168471 RepID=UPI001EFDFC4D|nr:hypothetical protein [Laribacter hongkongensis]MCG8993134.1 hypothetical protein [Laribacter hongkongensis]MCG8998374.1 hypothetical protein [Laribacter hongkongensis]MCG9000645.1 hypothetical protein [Laribacter hongkongensis]MCG9003822.1 hypothetical protein [Laribacter hongkongensis]MCG9007273.1 hypothetical protein [Laribacter hongkongensis]